VEGNDLSLFYGDVKELTTITDKRKFLPKEVYGSMVRDAVVCCVDCLIVKKNANGKKECLVVKRLSEPVKGVWYLPGGRLVKGETFFAAALRKAQQETGLTLVTPIQVLGVWNTLYPTSNWDTETEKGTQTVNAVVLVELNDAEAVVILDETGTGWRWIPLSPDAAVKNGEDRYVVEALSRLKAWDSTYDC
jgi:colanic acid biosynthesis protein WcaH